MIQSDIPPILKVENLSFSYDHSTTILKDISFSIKSGETLGVLGPNGGGKSTLMKIVAGILSPTSGNVYFNGIDVKSLSKYPYDLFSYIPQTGQLNTVMPVRVYEFLEYALSAHKISVDKNLISDLLSIVGMGNKRDNLMSNLSGGERQRVMIARAMVQKPKLLLLDEPTKGLDSNGQDQLLNLLKELTFQNDTVVMIVDHNINQIIKSCQKILCLNRNYHWHDNKDFLTKNILEDVYHCEFEHLLIHEKDLESNDAHNHHHFCDHSDHQHEHTHKSHPFIRRNK